MTVYFWYITYFFLYMIISRQIGLLLYFLVEGEAYTPQSGEDIERWALWIPLLGEIVGLFFLFAYSIVFSIRFLESASNIFALDLALEKFICNLKNKAEERRTKKKLSKENVYTFLRDNPEEFKKAAEEVERLLSGKPKKVSIQPKEN